MSYEAGDASIEETTDSRTDDYDEGVWIVLPHSCGEWVIGGAKEARQLIADLEVLIPQFEARER